MVLFVLGVTTMNKQSLLKAWSEWKPGQPHPCIDIEVCLHCPLFIFCESEDDAGNDLAVRMHDYACVELSRIKEPEVLIEGESGIKKSPEFIREYCERT